jgi:hypothetical protein
MIFLAVLAGFVILVWFLLRKELKESERLDKEMSEHFKKLREQK